MIGRQRNCAGRHLALLGLLLCMSGPFLAHAVPMVNDPTEFPGEIFPLTVTLCADAKLIVPLPPSAPADAMV